MKQNHKKTRRDLFCDFPPGSSRGSMSYSVAAHKLLSKDLCSREKSIDQSLLNDQWQSVHKGSC